MHVKVALWIMRGAILLVALALVLGASTLIAPAVWIEALCGAALSDFLVRAAASKNIVFTLSEVRIEGWGASRRLRLSNVEAKFAFGHGKDSDVLVVPRWSDLAFTVELRHAELDMGSKLRIDRIDGKIRLPGLLVSGLDVRLSGALAVKGNLFKVSVQPGSASCGSGLAASSTAAAGSVLTLQDRAGRTIAGVSYPELLSWLRPEGEGKICLDVAAPTELAGLITAATGSFVSLPQDLQEPFRSHGYVKWLGHPQELNFTVSKWQIETGNCRSEGELTSRSLPTPELHVELRRLDLKCLERQRAVKGNRLGEPLSLNTQCKPLQGVHDFLAGERPSRPLRLTIAELEWRERLLRNVEVAFRPARNTWQVVAGATLPDDADIKLELSHQEGESRDLAGWVRVDVPALQHTLAWLELDSRNSPLERVAKANLSAGIAWSRRRVAISSETLQLSDSEKASLLPNTHFSLSLDCERAGETLLDARLDVDSVDVLRLAPSGASMLRKNVAEGTLIQGLKVDLKASIGDGKPSQIRITSASVHADVIDLRLKPADAESTGAVERGAPSARGASWLAQLHDWSLKATKPTNLEAISKLKGPVEEFLSATVFQQVEFEVPVIASAARWQLRVGENLLADVAALSSELIFRVGGANEADNSKLRIAAKTSLGDSRFDTLHIARARLDVGLDFIGTHGRRTLESLTIGHTSLEGDAIDSIRPGMLPSETAPGGERRRVSFSFSGALRANVAKSEAEVDVAKLDFGDLLSLRDVDVRLGWNQGAFVFSANNHRSSVPPAAVPLSQPACTLARPAANDEALVRLDLNLTSGQPALLRRLRLVAQIGRNSTKVDALDLQAARRSGLRGDFAIAAWEHGETIVGGCLAANLDPQVDLKPAVEAFPDFVPKWLLDFARTNDQAVSLEAVGRLRGTLERFEGPVSLSITSGRASSSNRPQAVLPAGTVRLATHLMLDRFENIRLLPLLRGPGSSTDVALRSQLARSPNEARISGQNCNREPCTMRIDLGDFELKFNSAELSQPELRLRRIVLTEVESGERLELNAPAGRYVLVFGPAPVRPAADGRPTLTVAIDEMRGTHVRLLRQLKTPIEQLLPLGDGGSSRFTARILVRHLASWDAIAEWFGLSTAVQTHGAGIRDFDLTYEAGLGAGRKDTFVITGSVLNGTVAAVAPSSCAIPAEGARTSARFGRLKDGAVDLSGSIEKIGKTRTGSTVLAVTASGALRCIRVIPAWNLFFGRSDRARPVDLLAGHFDELLYTGRFQLGGEPAAPQRTSLLHLPGHEADLTAHGWAAFELYRLLQFAAGIYQFDPDDGMQVGARATVRDGTMHMKFWHNDPTPPNPSGMRLPRRLAGAVDWRLETRAGTVTAMARSGKWSTDAPRQCRNLQLPTYVERIVLQCREDPAGCRKLEPGWERPPEKFGICNLLTRHPDLGQ